MSFRYHRLPLVWMCSICSQAKESIKEFVTEHLPAVPGLSWCTWLNNKACIWYNWDIDDNREKLQAMELFKDIHLVKLELLSNSTTIDSALNYIRNKQQRERIVISLSCIVLSLLLFFINNCLYIDRKLAATILEVDKL